MSFKYEVNENDQSVSRVKADEEFYNYKETTLNEFDQSLHDLYYYILDDDEVALDYIYPKTNFNKKYVLNSIKLWKELGINLHDINIFKIFRNGNKYLIHDSGIFDSFKSKDPSSLKVSFYYIPQWDSKLILKEIDEDNYKNIVFNQIILPKCEKKLASTVYAHELAHTQLMTQDGGTNSIFNEEMIPILMEFIFADKLDNGSSSLKYVRNERLMSTAKFIDLLSKRDKLSFLNRVTTEKYIISSLQAMELFRIYYSSNEVVKKEILSDINDIFNGDKIVEDIINKYQIDYNDVSKKKDLKLF